MSEAPPEQKRSANQRKSSGKGYRVIAGLLLAAIIAAAVIGFFHLSRPQSAEVLRIGAGPLDSDSYQLIAEVADVVERNSSWLSVEVMETRDSSENISLLNSEQVDVATIRSDTPVVSDVRLVATLFSSVRSGV